MVLLYMLKILFGIISMNELLALLFSNVAAINLVGFNAHQARNLIWGHFCGCAL